MTVPLIQAIAETSAGRIVDCLVEGSVIAGFGAMMLRLSRRQSSGTRFAAWFSTLMAIAALPVLNDVAWLHRGWFPQSIVWPSIVRTAITLPGSWALYLFAAWALLAAWYLIRVVLGLRHLFALRQSCMPVELSQLDGRLRQTLEGKQGSRAVSLCTSERVQVPTAIGLIRPMVVVPQWLMDELSVAELNQILLHELAHLRRWDDWTNLAQQLVKALFFFHPAVWWIEKKISLEREMACDDAVLTETESPRAYAECLTHLAERTLVRRSIALAQAALGRVRQTSLRVARILDVNRPRKTKYVWTPALLLTGFAILCTSIAAKEPALIAFRDFQPDVSVAAIDSSTSPALRPIPAAFHPEKADTIAAPRAVRAALHPRLVHAMPANHIASPDASRQLTRFEHSFVIEDALVAPTLIHLTSSTESMGSTEAIFVLVDRRSTADSQQPVWEIRVWRLTLHPAVNSISKQIPNKET
jgi:beta-lactamase regulating signal transducer with metallopeptidase domain